MGRKGKKRSRGGGSGVLLFCYFCDREFPANDVLLNHQRAKHFQCPQCPKRAGTSKGLARHMINVHKTALEKVPGAMRGREQPNYVVGMQHVPAEVIYQKQMQRAGVLGPSTKKVDVGSAGAGGVRPPAPPSSGGMNTHRPPPPPPSGSGAPPPRPPTSAPPGPPSAPNHVGMGVGVPPHGMPLMAGGGAPLGAGVLPGPPRFGYVGGAVPPSRPPMMRPGGPFLGAHRPPMPGPGHPPFPGPGLSGMPPVGPPRGVPLMHGGGHRHRPPMPVGGPAGFARGPAGGPPAQAGARPPPMPMTQGPVGPPMAQGSGGPPSALAVQPSPSTAPGRWGPVAASAPSVPSSQTAAPPAPSAEAGRTTAERKINALLDQLAQAQPDVQQSALTEQPPSLSDSDEEMCVEERRARHLGVLVGSW